MAEQARALEDARAQTGAELGAREAGLREREEAAAAAAQRREEDARQRALQDEQAAFLCPCMPQKPAALQPLTASCARRPPACGHLRVGYLLLFVLKATFPGGLRYEHLVQGK